MELLEEVALFMTRRQSSRMLVDDLQLETLDAARVGIVFGVPTLVAHLDRLASEPGGPTFVLANMRDLSEVSATDYRALAAEVDVLDVGGDVLDLLLADRRAVVSSLLAKRAAISEHGAERLLAAVAPVLLICLSRNGAADHGPSGLTAVLDREVAKLCDGGWGPWVTEVTTPGNRTTRGRAEPLPTTFSVERTGLRRPVSPPGPPAPANPAYEPPRPDPVPVPAMDGDSSRPEPQRTSGLLGPALSAALAAIVLVGLATWLLSRGDGPSDPALASAEGDSSVDGTGTTDETGTTDDIDEVEDDPPDASDEADDGEAARDADAGDLARIELALADPLGRLDGTGFANLTLDRVSGEVCYDFDVQGVASPYDGHIHVGPAGVKGGIVIDFGELDGPTSGCLDNRPVDTNAILDDLAGHYVEFHDADEVNTVRAQLAEAEMIDGATVDQDQDAEERGAVVVISDGALILQGEVPDQVAIDKMVESFADIDLGSTRLINELTVVPGSPRPSGRIVVDDTILFGVDSDQLASGASTVLDDLATILRARPAWSATVVGHTDSTGPEVYNLELSLRRAESVRAALTAAGVPDEVLTIRGAGATAPVGDNATPDGRRQNRRIELEVVAG